MNLEGQIPVMLVSQPGALQKILLNSLQGLPVAVVGVASGGLSAAAMLKGRQPDLLIVDANVPVDETLALLEHVQRKYPEIYCLALSETSQGKQGLQAGGANSVVLSFDLPLKLPEVIAEVQAPGRNAWSCGVRPLKRDRTTPDW